MTDQNQQPENDAPATGYGSPEMAALLEEAKLSLQNSEALWESAGFDETTLKAAYESLTAEEQAAYDLELTGQRDELARERRHARDAAKAKVKPTAIPKTGSTTRTRIRI